IVKYRYDAYGNTTVVSDTSGGIVSFYNPYTYRGYRYDSEIGMYYLNSRYYNPQIGRFLNGDGMLGQTADPMSTNMFIYARNNPVQLIDEQGFFWHIIGGALIGAAVGATIQILSNCISGDKWYNDLGGAILGGAVGGALTAMGVPSVIVGFSVGLATGIGNQIDDACANWQCDISKVSVAEIVADGIVSGMFAGFGSSFANSVVGYSSKQVASWIKPQSLFKFFSGGFGDKVMSMIAIGSVPNVITAGIDSVTNLPDFEEVITDVWNYITSSK
ncbi:MAG: RHS repeat-associated core domain-containing protein, partial [Candidatus Izemoplasmatales bacterium]